MKAEGQPIEINALSKTSMTPKVPSEIFKWLDEHP
jgi:hypothetical protein